MFASKVAKKVKKSRSAGSRRVPTQERSKRRVQSIVDAAAHLFAEQGFDHTTIDDIATRAKTSVGSLYQFFPNKLEIFRAVADASIRNSEVLFTEQLAGDVDPSDWFALIERMMDGFTGLHAQDPAFRALVANMHMYALYEAEDTALSRRMVETAEAIIALWFPRLPAERRGAVARTVVYTIEGQLILAQREDTEMAARMLAESKIMLRRYLAPMIEEWS